MGVFYQQLLHNVALRSNALIGTQVAALATTYDTATLTAANFKSADWPFNSFRDAILMAEENYAEAVASNREHTSRSSLASATAALPSPALLPQTDAGGTKKIIGAWGAVFDGSDSTPLTWAPIKTVNRRVRNSGSHYLTPVHLYNITGRRFIHTRATAIIEVCIYDRATQLTGFNANTTMLLTDEFEQPITSRAIVIMCKGRVGEDRLAPHIKLSDDALIRTMGVKTVPIQQ